MADHLLRFRQKDTAYLQTKQAELEAMDASPFLQQTMGTKSFTIDKRNIMDQLNAIAFVLRERGTIAIIKPPLNIGVGITDFSEIQ